MTLEVEDVGLLHERREIFALIHAVGGSRGLDSPFLPQARVRRGDRNGRAKVAGQGNRWLDRQ